MGEKGVTIIELLIVIVVMGIVSAFSIVAVSNIVENTKEESFINTAMTMLTSTNNAFNHNDPLFSDGKATLQELIDNDYIELSSKDPWGGLYDTTNSYVILDDDLKVRLISATASIGYDGPLKTFDNNDVIYVDGHGSNVINGIIESITGNVSTSLTGNNDNDSIIIDGDLQGNGAITTFDGNDIVNVAGDIRQNARIDTGAGDDTIEFDMLRGNSIVIAGEGNDSLTIIEVRYRTLINMGSGNDFVTISSILNNYRGSIIMGSGDDILTISDGGTPFQGVNGTFTGGSGNDILNLPDVNRARWEEISNMFGGFETINLSDTTISN